MPNEFAYVMLLAWPVIAAGLFSILPFQRALIWSVLGAYLLLPPQVQFDFPLVPPLDKTSIPNLVALFACVFVLGKRLSLLPDSRLGQALLVLFVVVPVATVLTNGEPYVNGVAFRPGLRIHDAVSAVVNQAVFLLPFFIARNFLASEAAQREILVALVLAGLVYSVPILLEVRLSPQLNVWLYGFFPHSFEQHMRFGGFRPVVFLGHGLLVAFFIMTTLLAAVALSRAAKPGHRFPLVLPAAWLGIILVLCKSLGALVHAAVFLPIIALSRGGLQIRLAALLAVVAILYPLLRGADLVPADTMVEYAAAVDPARAESLQFRFHNEDVLLERASEKPLFGWGFWGRNEVYDPETGRSVAVTDGRWIIVIGTFGWAGYIVEFGLLALPLLLLRREERRSAGTALSPYAGPLALILAANIVELLPNSALTALTWMVAGALLGYAEALKAERTQAAPPQGIQVAL